MTPLEIARSRYERKRTELQTLTDTCVVDGQPREMTADENTRFNTLATEARSAQTAVTELEAAEPPAAGSGDGSSFRSKRIDGAPAIHATEHRYSMLAALRYALDKDFKTGVEGEVHSILSEQRSKENKPRGILIPLGNEEHPKIRSALYGKNAERRDATFNTAAAAASIFVHEMPFIDLLRNATVLKELGATFLTGLDGKLGFPRQNGSATAYWLAEGVPVDLTKPSLDQVTMENRTLAAATRITRKTLFQSSLDVENFVRSDLALALAAKLEATVFNGDGSNGGSKGICQNANVQTQSANLAIGANGGVPNSAQLIAMESLIEASGASRLGPISYAVTPGMKGLLKSTPRLVGSNSANPVWGDDDTVNGRKAVATNFVPTGLTKGTSNATCQAIIAGVFRDLLIGQWGGIDTTVNEMSEQLAGNVIISMFSEFDFALRHDQSFAVITDAKVS